MAQVSDVSLANQGFSAFRTELNNILTRKDAQSFLILILKKMY